jgi:tropomyosin, fungi type
LLLQKEQEISSLNHRLSVTDASLEKAEAKLTETKLAATEGEQSKTTNEGLLRKIQMLEEELDATEKNVKETVEKYVLIHIAVNDRD